jgi:hypothetical protein
MIQIEAMHGPLVAAHRHVDRVGVMHGGDSRADAARRQSRCPEM